MPRNDNAVANVDVLLEQKAANVVHYLFCHSFFSCWFFKKKKKMLMFYLEPVLKLNTK